jgi:ORF6N domain
MNDLITSPAFIALSERPLLYNGQPCITLRLMDQLHERPDGTAGRNFRQHRERLTEGKHCFTVPYDAWSQWPDGGTHFVEPSERAGSGHKGDLILLTERGYLLLVKSFRDDLAWQVQEALVDSYFRKQPELLRPWSLRLNSTTTDHQRDLCIRHSPNWWTVILVTVHEQLSMEDEFLRHALPLTKTDLADGSIGRRWAGYRMGEPWAGPIYNDVPLTLPEWVGGISDRIVYPNVYGPDELPHFRLWLYTIYMPEHLPVYALRKFPQRDYSLRPAIAVNRVCQNLAGCEANLGRRLRGRLEVAGHLGTSSAGLFD